MKKILRFNNHNEGDTFRYDALFVLGRLIQQDNFNGIYIVFNSPIKYNTNYVSSDDFKSKNGTCFNRYVMMIRKCNGKTVIATNKAVSHIK